MRCGRVLVAGLLSGLCGCGNAPSALGPSNTVTAEGIVRTEVTFVTSDGLTLSGHLTQLTSDEPDTTAAQGDNGPGVVLVHQYLRDDAQWGDFPETLATAGYAVLAFNLRGHGDSDDHTTSRLSDLLSDSNQAPRDVEAALAFLGAIERVDGDRLAVIGTSIGANLTVAAAIDGGARTYVALTARMSAVEALADAPATGMASVFYIVAENESPQNENAGTMFNATAEPREVLLVEDSSAHGIALLERHAEVTTRILEWLQLTL